MRSQYLSIKLPSEYTYSAVASEELRNICAMSGVHSSVINQVELGLVEAINNVIEHAYKDQADHTFEFSCEVFDTKIVIKLKDSGLSMPANKINEAKTRGFVEPDATDPETWLTSGRGLPIILSCVDHLDYQTQSGINTLTMEKYLPHE